VTGIGWWGWRLLGSGGIIRAGAGLDGSARTTTCHWGRRAVVARWLVIDLFELKFDHLNTNLTVSTKKLIVFDHYGSKSPKQIPKNLNLVSHHSINTSMV
jgi:hypothetical protein